MAEAFPTEVFNHDVVWLYDLVRRFHTELAYSQSAPVSGMIDADQARLVSYINAMRAALDWIQSSPQLDLPETHPRPYIITSFPEEITVENESINVILRLIRASAVELLNSQSARYSSRLQPFDESRLASIFDKIELFLNNYIRGQAVPLDLPESSPQRDQVESGRQGV